MRERIAAYGNVQTGKGIPPMETHQIRLSADGDFQSCLQAVRRRACSLGVSTGKITDIVRAALLSASGPELIRFGERHDCTFLTAPARAPKAASVEVSGPSAMKLKQLLGELIGEAPFDASLRVVVHASICLLAERDDEAFRSAFTRKT